VSTLFTLAVHMSEEDLEVLITLDDPGEDSLEEDTFHEADNTGAHRSSQPAGDVAGQKK
jgi:hypothetical protein